MWRVKPRVMPGQTPRTVPGATVGPRVTGRRGARRALARLLVAAVVVALVGACGSKVDDLRNSGDVQGIVTILETDPAAQTRADAAAALADLGATGGPNSRAAAEAVEHLSAALSDESATVRTAAAAGLGGQQLDTAAVPLFIALDDEVAEVGEAADQAITKLLGELQPAAVAKLLIDALDHDRPAVRTAAARWLGSTGSATELTALLGALADADPGVKRAAGEAVTAVLARARPADAAAVLAAALRDVSPTVREAAAIALAKVGTEPTLMELVRTMSDSDAAVRTAAEESLATILRRMSAEVAVAAMLDIVGSAEDPDREPAAAAFETLLLGLGPSRAAAAITAAEAGDSWLAVALEVPVSRLASETRRLGIQLEPLDEIVAAAARARSGKAVPGSHRYALSKLFHPAVVFSSSGLPTETDRWAPTAMRFLELVVTEKTTWKRIQVCRYYGPDISRYRAYSTVRVISAATGKVVASRTFAGSAPRRCRQTEPYSLTRLDGGDPPLASAVTWLNSLIHPPAAP